MLWTTPESLREQLPLMHQAGDLVLTADARIDNRDELIAILDFGERPPGEISDSELILGAYARWGECCPEKLLGAFAFVLWDGRKQLLFCARDHFGVKPFYYYLSDRAFAFASEIKALLCLSQVPRRLNEVRVAEYLASMFVDKTITFYQEILRLAPAHSMTVSKGGTRQQTYWSLDPSRELRLGSDAEYAEAFRDLFTEAVRCRLRSAFPIGSLLSGGLDSSSVTCVAQRLLAQDSGQRLKTFSAVFDEVTECDERPFIYAVLAQDGVEPYYVQGDRVGPLADLDRVLWHQDEAFYAPGLTLSWLLYDAVHIQGVRVLLDGFDGDSTVSHGHGYLHELARAGRWLALSREAWGLGKMWGESPWQGLWALAWHYKLSPMISASRVLSRLRSIGVAVLQRVRRMRTCANGPTWRDLIAPDFVERMGLVKRHRAWRQAQLASARDERQRHYRILTAGIQPFALEVFDRSAAAFSVQARYPFWDRRLVEFCLALPPEQKLNRGWSRMVLRRAMSGILPAKVQWRRDKSNFTPNFSRGLLVFERERLDEVILREPEIITAYVDISTLREFYARSLSQGITQRSQDVLAIWRAVSLALWLRNWVT
jgi:asparagine synthase (glutamine-hydrolysing)